MSVLLLIFPRKSRFIGIPLCILRTEHRPISRTGGSLILRTGGIGGHLGFLGDRSLKHSRDKRGFFSTNSLPSGGLVDQNQQFRTLFFTFGLSDSGYLAKIGNTCRLETHNILQLGIAYDIREGLAFLPAFLVAPVAQGIMQTLLFGCEKAGSSASSKTPSSLHCKVHTQKDVVGSLGGHGPNLSLCVLPSALANAGVRLDTPLGFGILGWV